MTADHNAEQGAVTRRTGTIVSFVQEQGCGFIQSGERSVEFRTDDLIDREHDVIRLKDGAQVSFELMPTPTGYSALKLKVEQDAPAASSSAQTSPLNQSAGAQAVSQILYQVPDNIPIFEGAVGGAFELLSEASDFYISVSDVSLDAARDRLRVLAASIGANALHSVKYSFDEGRRGQTIHHFVGVPCFVGRKSENGTITRSEVPFDLNQRAEKYFEGMQSAAVQQSTLVRNRLGRLDVVVLGLALFFIALSRFWGFVSLGIGAVFMIVFIFRVLTVLSSGKEPELELPGDNSIFRRK